MVISHEVFITILKEKDRYEMMKEKWKWRIIWNYETELCEIKDFLKEFFFLVWYKSEKITKFFVPLKKNWYNIKYKSEKIIMYFVPFGIIWK